MSGRTPASDMFNVGPLELMVILVIALLVVGPKRLPEVGRSIGRGLREFRRAQEEVRNTLRMDLDLDEDIGGPSRTRTSPPSPGSDIAPAGSVTELEVTDEPPTGNGEVSGSVGGATEAPPSEPSGPPPPAPSDDPNEPE